jgi:hypothetical protein
MYPSRFIQYLNLPSVPTEILKNISTNPADYKFESGSYWTDQHNQKINEWCQQHISAEMYFAFQCFDTDVDLHQDIGTEIKLNYLINTGGDQVSTEFYNSDRTTLLAQYTIDSHRWHIFRANVPHRVCNLQPNCVRFAITGRVF